MTGAISKREVDLTNGPIFKKLIIFAIPIILANTMQLLFNATDIAVLRIMVNQDAVASVGATTSLIHLLVNFFMGLSVGASVVLGKCVGAQDIKKARKVVGTAISISLIAGIMLMIIGYFLSETFLIWMNCPENLLEGATKYLKIYFLGMPIILFYNFAAGMLRAVGDSFRPMLYLIIAGFVNVGLNVFFIAVFNMTVEGVAIGTIASQLIASVLSFITMRKSDGYAKIEYKNLVISKNELKEIFSVGIPSGLQSSLFSISNVLISSTINTFGPDAVAGNTAAQQVDMFMGTFGASLAQANMSFVSQNYGAKKINRIKKSIKTTLISILIMQILLGAIVNLLARPLTSIFLETENAFNQAKIRLSVVATFYFLGNVMDALAYSMRAMGKTTISMITTIFFVCIFRIIWLNTFYLLNPTLAMIYISYPVSWILTIVAHLFLVIPLIKKLEKNFNSKKDNQQEKIA